jgi:branched-chain amino acid aminotransferase
MGRRGSCEHDGVSADLAPGRPRLVVVADGQLVDPAAAVVSVLDRSLWYGDGLFEVLRTVGTTPVDGWAHLERLRAAVHWRGRAAPAHEALSAAVSSAARAWGGSARLRVLVTAGGGELSVAAPPRVFVIADALPALPAAPVALVTVDAALADGLAGHKTLAYLDRLRARELAVAAGGDDAIRLTARGEVGETATANLFLVHGDRIATPPAAGAVLPGVTRARVLALAAATGVPVEERVIAPAELQTADEAFLTSAVRGLTPCRSLDGRALQAPGRRTRALAEAYDAFLASIEATSDGAVARAPGTSTL